MPIISLSISADLNNDIKAFSKKNKVGKSEFTRAALSSYIDSHYSKLINPKQEYTVSLSIICSESHKNEIHEILHTVVVRSQFHLCLGRNRCIEVFGISSKGSVLLQMMRRLETLPKIEKMQLCIDK